MEEIRIKLDPGAVCPTRAHETDAGLDLYSMEEKIILPALQSLFPIDSCSATFDTGVHMEIPRGYFGKIESRSGLNVRNDVVSCGGVIDADYRGSIVVKLYNLGSRPYTVHKGDRIAQLIIQPCALSKLEIVQELDETERNLDGFGSTGV